MRVVIAGESAVRDQTRQAVLSNGLRCAAEDCVSPGDLVPKLAAAPPDLVLVCLDGTAAGLRVVQTAVSRTAAPVLAVGRFREAPWLRQAQQHGARECLQADDLRSELLAALTRLKRAGVVSPNWGWVVPVLAAKPGSGVTTVASNLAIALARRAPGRVALAELGTGVPELALTLDLTPPHDLKDLVGTAERLDAPMLRRALTEHPARLSVLAHPAEALATATWDPATVRQVLVLLRAMFEFTVVDLGHAVGPAGDELVHLADQVLLVVGLDVPSLRLGRRLLKHLTEAGLAKEKVQVIANRYGQSQQFPWRQAQDYLDRPILEWIPDDPARVNAAMNQGQPLYLLGRSAIARCFDNLASLLNGRAQAYGDVG